MNIAINAMPIDAYGGLTYLQEVLPRLDALENGYRWFVYARPATVAKLSFPARRVVFRPVPFHLGRPGRLLIEQLWLPRLFEADGIDVVYTATNVDLFLARQPTVIEIRNLEPFLHQQFPNSFPQRWRCRVLAALSRLSLQTATRIMCVSEFARDVALPPQHPCRHKATVIPHGCDPARCEAAARPVGAPPRYLFTSGRMAGYANLLTLIEAYAICRQLGVTEPLVIAGGPHDAGYERRVLRQIHRLGLEPHVRRLGYVPHKEFLGWLRHSSLFVFPSLLEACPNTLLEAMACGQAIVASRTPAAVELAGEAAEWCSGTDAASMAAAIVRVLREPGRLEWLRQRAKEQVRKFPWESSIQRLCELIESTKSMGRLGRPVPLLRESGQPSVAMQKQP